jgi:hypothetical protein
MLAAGLKSPYVLIPFGLPALAFMVRYGFADCVVVEEGLQPYQARSRSIRLTAGRRAGLLGLAVLTYLVPACLEIGGETLAALVTGVDAEQATALVPSVVSGVFGLASSLLYLVPTIAFYLRYKEASRESSHRE